MFVNRDFRGKALMPTTLDKAHVKQKFIDNNGLDSRLKINGGVEVENMQEVARRGGGHDGDESHHPQGVVDSLGELQGVDDRADGGLFELGGNVH